MTIARGGFRGDVWQNQSGERICQAASREECGFVAFFLFEKREGERVRLLLVKGEEPCLVSRAARGPCLAGESLSFSPAVGLCTVGYVQGEKAARPPTERHLDFRPHFHVGFDTAGK